MAHGGTIFLDEIGEMPRYVQVKLLRVLQEKCIQRLGSEEELPVDVRIMAATNRDLDEEIRLLRFRRDLYYRLGVVTLDVPPLREHPEDIPELLDRYLEEFRVSLRRNVTKFSEEAVGVLCRYEWPGNVRELINVVERAVLLCEENEVTLVDLPPGLGSRIELRGSRQEGPLHLSPDWLPAEWPDLPWSRLRRMIVSGCERGYLLKHLAENARPRWRDGASHRTQHSIAVSDDEKARPEEGGLPPPRTLRCPASRPRNRFGHGRVRGVCHVLIGGPFVAGASTTNSARLRPRTAVRAAAE